MGRRTHFAQRGISGRSARNGLVADREIERALQQGGMPSFGIRRQVKEPWDDEILEVVFGLQAHGELPGSSELEVCCDLGVTVLGQRVLLERVRRGAVNAGQLERTRIALGKISTRRDSIRVKLGEVYVHKNRLICASVVGDEIGREEGGVQSAVVVSGGLRGVVLPQSHLTLAAARNGDTISRAAQADAITALTEKLPSDIELLHWKTYPNTNVFAGVSE